MTDPNAAIPDGVAVAFDISGERARVGIIKTENGRSYCVPMAKHLLRDVTVEVDRASVVSLESLQAEIAPRPSTAGDPVQAAFEPIIEVAAGTVLAEPLKSDPTRYRFYQVVEDVVRAYNDFELDKSATVRRFDVRHGPYGDEITRRHRHAQPVRSLAGLSHLQYHAVPDRFLSVLRIPIITEWQVEDIPATAVFPTKRLEGPASLTIRDGRAEAAVQAPERPLFVDEPSGIDVAAVYRKFEHGTIAPSGPSTPLWSAADVRYVGGSFGGGDAIFRFMVPRVTLAFGDGDVVATRETFRGLTLKGFGHRIVPEYPTGFELITARNAYIVKIYGRDARIVQSGANHVSLIHEGGPLEDGQVDGVQTLIQYLCGNRGQHITTETFGGTGRLTFEFRERGGPTERGQPPIQLDHWTTTTNFVAPQFESMLSAIRRLRDKAPAKLDAAFHHYFEGVNSSYPVTRILMLAVAIDTLVALQIGNQREALIIDNRVFQRASKPIRAAVETALAAEHVPSDKATKILNNLQSLNNASAAQRRRDFWADLGINLTTEEAAVLKSRHEVVHEGHVGSERTSAALLDNYRRSGVLANLFNRAMLALLGWSGPYLDATVTDRHVELPLHAPRSGESAEAAIPSADVSKPARSSGDSPNIK